MHPYPHDFMADLLGAALIFAGIAVVLAVVDAQKAAPRHGSSLWWIASRTVNVILTLMLVAAIIETLRALDPTTAIQFGRLWWITMTLGGLVALTNITGVTRFVKRDELTTVGCLLAAVCVVLLQVVAVSSAVLPPEDTAIIMITVFLVTTPIYLDHLKKVRRKP